MEAGKTTAPVVIEHQLYHCPRCGKVIRESRTVSISTSPALPTRAVLHWCGNCELGQVTTQRFNGCTWDFLGETRETPNPDYLQSLCNQRAIPA